MKVVAIIDLRGKSILREEAMEYIFGYTIPNDLCLRDQPNDRGLSLSKNFDTSAPHGTLHSDD